MHGEIGQTSTVWFSLQTPRRLGSLVGKVVQEFKLANAMSFETLEIEIVMFFINI